MEFRYLFCVWNLEMEILNYHSELRDKLLRALVNALKGHPANILGKGYCQNESHAY
jgi:hypothetical protein